MIDYNKISYKSFLNTYYPPQPSNEIRLYDSKVAEDVTRAGQTTLRSIVLLHKLTHGIMVTENTDKITK